MGPLKKLEKDCRSEIEHCPSSPIRHGAEGGAIVFIFLKGPIQLQRGVIFHDIHSL